ncbi:hypothetical protein JI435_405640, partial [Parastagonospora nodorum SN15]
RRRMPKAQRRLRIPSPPTPTHLTHPCIFPSQHPPTNRPCILTPGRLSKSLKEDLCYLSSLYQVPRWRSLSRLFLNLLAYIVGRWLDRVFIKVFDKLLEMHNKWKQEESKRITLDHRTARVFTAGIC